MAAATITSFVAGLQQCRLLSDAQRVEVERLGGTAREVRELAIEVLRRDWLTAYQINQILQGKGDSLTLGPFILLERIGEGGMGQVFKARQKLLNRVVALKVIRKECVNNPKVNRRFQREIRAAGQLSHPHIVRAYDADQVNGTYYIAMEFIDGVDLARLLKDNGPLPVEQACEYIRQAALGLQHACERGMVHRDIKPANLLVTRAVASDRRRSSGLIQRPLDLNLKRTHSALPRIDPSQHYPWGMVKILDMGLARYTDPFTGQTATHLTQLGSVMGTPEFIAPEQARDSHTSDIRADLYSLGCTLYFLLTGQPPFPNGTLTEKLLQHQFDEVPPVEQIRREKMLAWQGTAGPVAVSEEMLQVPIQVENVLRRLLAKLPEDRFQTPNELANELQSILGHIAAGTLPKVVPSKRADPDSVIILLPDVDVEVEPSAAGDKTAVMLPLVNLSSRRDYANRGTALIALALASLGGLAFITMLTVIAVLMSRGNTTQAGVVDAPPAVKSIPKK